MAEATMICVDNSCFMCSTYGGEGLMKTQTQAIELYCREKLKAHPGNMVGFTTMGPICLFCKPSRDLEYFWSTFELLECGGSLRLPNCLMYGNFGLQSSGLPKKRLVMFAGGPLHTTIPALEDFATMLREVNIAVDVVNFGIQDHNRSGRKNRLLQAFVAAVNGRYLYAPIGSPYPLSTNLSSSPIMPRVEQALEETKPHQNKAAVADDENVEPLGMKKDHQLVNSKEKPVSYLEPHGMKVSELVPVV